MVSQTLGGLEPRSKELKRKGVIGYSSKRRRHPSSGQSAVGWVTPEYAAQRDAQSRGQG